MESLPRGWASAISKKDGLEYYYTTEDNSNVSWIHPSKHYSLYGDREFVKMYTTKSPHSPKKIFKISVRGRIC